MTEQIAAAAAVLDAQQVPMDGRMIEPIEGANRGNAGKGRPAGSLNKTTRAAKEAIAFAAEGLGGAERLIAWAQSDEKNESAFWVSIYPKLLPLTVGGDADNPVKLVFGWMSE